MSSRLETYLDIWRQGRGPGLSTVFPGWPQSGVALAGDFAGIQTFVFRPIPGAGGAARRLRSRSFRVGACTELIARWCCGRLSALKARLLYSAGGRFLIGMEASDDWEKHVVDLQGKIDAWTWRNFEGELVFHLAAAPFDSLKIPRELLQTALERRKANPLYGSLCSSEGWLTSEFFRTASPADSRCASCGSTVLTQRTSDNEDVCEGCLQDERNGRRLAQSRFARIVEGTEGDVSALGLALELHPDKRPDEAGVWLSLEGGDDKLESWPLFRHVPFEDGRALDFDEIAKGASGSRKWLGYLRIDVDHAGRQFALLRGDPLRTWALSRFLNGFFATEANKLLRTSYPNLYGVYGGGDDVFVIGPWSDTLDFAHDLRRRFRELVGGDLTFSAGIALAKPRQHILSKAEEAAEELESAKLVPGHRRSSGRDQIRALSVTCGWDDFDQILPQAKQVKSWLESGELSSRFLYQALELHRAWLDAKQRSPNRETGSSVRYRPLLYYQIRRNLKAGAASQWAHSLLHSPSDWTRVDFVVRYALLAAERASEEER